MGASRLRVNRELCTKLIQKKCLPSTAHESQFSDKQKFHSAPKQRRPISTEILSNWQFILWLQGPASSAWWFTFLSREFSTSWYEVRHLPTLGVFPLSHFIGTGQEILSKRVIRQRRSDVTSTKDTKSYHKWDVIRAGKKKSSCNTTRRMQFPDPIPMQVMKAFTVTKKINPKIQLT